MYSGQKDILKQIHIIIWIFATYQIQIKIKIYTIFHNQAKA